MSNSSETVEKIIELTEKAVNKMTGLLAERPDGAGIRLGVVGGGCAGLQYQMDPCDEAAADDISTEVSGVRFYLNPMVIPYLKGITIDFSDELIDGGFKFINPNANSTCGCGTSFGV